MARGEGAEEMDVVVVGAGLAGYKAAQDLAQLGLQVLLVERRPHAGGALGQHDGWFPGGDCSWCKTLPLFAGDTITERCLRRQLDQPNLEVATATTLQRIAGERGHFTATLETEAAIIDPDLCTACQRCAEVCPVEVPDEFDEGVTTRRAAYIRHPLAVPATYTIDLDACTRCGECVRECPTGAIDLSREGDTVKRTVNAKAAVLTAGFSAVDPAELPQYRHGRHADVYTNLQFERHISGSAALARRHDGSPMRKVAILHCIGSRDEDHDWCSSACCLVAVKEARMVKERDPSAEVALFYMDMRDQARDGHLYARETLAMKGVRSVRARPSSVELGPKGELNVVYADEAEGVVSEPFDAVVLQVGQAPPADVAELADAAGVELDRHGFIARAPGSATGTSREGVFVAGSAGGPKDIQETVVEAAAAAMEAARVAGTEREAAPEPPACLAQGKEPVTAVLLCRCSGELERAIDVDALAEHSRTLPRVVAVRDVDLLCKGKVDLAGVLEGTGANRLVVVACPDHQWRRAFLGRAEEAGVQRDLVELVDGREWLSWVNPGGEAATERAQSMVAMASERLRTAVPRAGTVSRVVGPRALVVGGGVAGIVAALDVAAAGFEVDLVEKRDRLGGNVLDIPLTARGADARHLLSDLGTRVEAEPGVSVLMGTEVADARGSVGAFSVTLRDRSTKEESTSLYGAIVVATGGARNLPRAYGLREIDGVMDHFGLEDVLSAGDAVPSRVVMIQCAGSREEGGLPYCSRVCCTRALRNAMELRRRDPAAEVVVLNRDIVTYGTLEELYTQAREAGVRFLRFDPDDRPKVREEDGTLVVEVRDPGLGEIVVLEADAVVLSTGIVPRPLGKLAGLLRTEVDPHGFLASPSTKFRPVDAFRDGVYACGLVTGPRVAEESMASAHAAAARVVTVLRREALPVRLGISTVNLRTCSACGLCVSQCPFQARYLDPDDGKARVDEAACWGCGVCAQVCPNGAASMATRSERQAIHQVDAASWHG